jgi:hypothetical protein
MALREDFAMGHGLSLRVGNPLYRFLQVLANVTHISTFIFSNYVASNKSLQIRAALGMTAGGGAFRR